MGPIIGSITEFGPVQAAKISNPAYAQWRLLTMGKYLNRLDFLSIYQWLSGAFIRVSLSIFLMGELFQIKSRKIKNIVLIAISVSLIIALCIPIDIPAYRNFTERYYFKLSVISILVITFFINMVIFLKERVKRMEPLLNKANKGSSSEIQLKTEYFNELFGMSSDVKFKKHTITSEGKTDPPLICTLIYSEVLVDVKKLWESVARLDSVFINSKLKEEEVIEDPQDEFKVSRVFPSSTLKENVEENVFSGMVLILFEELELLFMFSLPSIPNRSPEETSSEISIRGPRDGFIEDISVNLGLIRKRYKTASLENQAFTIGKRSKTKINLLYVKDVVNPETIEKVKRKIFSINTDILLGTTELEEFLSGSKFNLIPFLIIQGGRIML